MTSSQAVVNIIHIPITEATINPASAKNGSIGHYINLWAYPGEKPVLDFSALTYATTSRGIQIGRDYWYFKGLFIQNAGDNGMYISGNNNIVENCTFYNNKDTGLQLSNGASNNYIHNCDAYGNNDPATHGQNADGIDVKLDAGPGNILRGCRAFNNADDGYDCYQTANKVVFDSCWAFHNGYNLWGISGFTGNGNGFKVGGNFAAGPHKLTNCVSFDNTVKGFDQNNNTSGVTLYNCTGYRNGTYNFSFPTVPITGQDTLKNNLSYLAISGGAGGVKLDASSLQVKNSWNGFSVSINDFLSLDTSLARIARLSDGSIPATNFLRLKPGSSLIDAGVNVGLPFNGSAPDLGAFENSAIILPVQLLSFSAVATNSGVNLNWSLAGEWQNKGWTIERAAAHSGSLSWSSIGFVNGAINSSTTTHYSFPDHNIFSGDYYYRLEQVDLNSHTSYSNTILVKIKNGQKEITLDNFPNPFNQSTTIRYRLPAKSKVFIQLYNSSGQQVHTVVNEIQDAGTYQQWINTASFPAGKYMLKLFACDKMISTSLVRIPSGL